MTHFSRINSLTGKYSITARVQGAAVLAAGLLAATILSGCGFGRVATDNSTDTIVPAIHGILHGGPNPVVGARVVMYATTSTGYGVGQVIQEATQVGGSAHQDTSSTGAFTFPGGVSCPANQYVYVVAYGGNTGGSGANPNSVLMTALGPCSTLYSGTTYAGNSNGTNIWVSEATTVAAAYALANFIAVTGNSVSGYTVGVGAPATNNNGSTGCVTNAYYPSCTATVAAAAGLGHAFNNAVALVNTATGIVNATTTNGATIPTVEINTLANAVQACVNSGGGGTNGSGTPSTTTTTSGTSHDGTACGKLFAFTSYTNTGQPTGTLMAAGNTLDALIDLVKRPAGSASTFNSTCDSNSGTGTTTAATCIFNLAGTIQGFVPALSAAPGDWMIGISYAKGGLSTSTSSVFTGGTCGNTTTTTNNGLLYPWWVASDINDDIVILNGDASTVKCAEIIAIGPDGSSLGTSSVDTTTLPGVQSLALDAWGHVAVPVGGGSTVRFYEYNGQGTADGGDSSITYLTAATPVTTAPSYAQFDSSSRLYVSAQSGVTSNPWAVINPASTPGISWHTTPSYGTATGLGTATSNKLYTVAIDVNNNAFSESSSKIFLTAAGTTNTTSPASIAGASGTYYVIEPDSSGNTLWNIVNNGTTATEVIKYTYNNTPTVTTTNTLASPAYTFSGPVNSGPKAGVIDGNNVIWFPDFTGTTGTTPATGGFLRGYDTVNNYGTPVLQGCKLFTTGTAYPITAWSITSGTGTTFTLSSSTTTLAVGAVLTLSGFPTSTFFNNVQVTVSASSAGSFTVTNTFGQPTSNATESGTATSRASTACGDVSGDTTYPSNSPFLIYASRGIAVDTMGNLWIANGTQGQVNEILGIAAPTWPNYIHNGVSNKP